MEQLIITPKTKISDLLDAYLNIFVGVTMIFRYNRTCLC